MRTPLKVSPAPTVSATTTGTPGTSSVVPSGRTATAPSPPRVTTTSPGPAPAQRVAVCTGSSSGWSQWRSSSLTLTTSARVTSSSTRATGPGAVRGDGRTGVGVERDQGAATVGADRVEDGVGARARARSRSSRRAARRSRRRARRRGASRGRSRRTPPRSSSRVTTALDVRPLAVGRASTVTPLASSHARTIAPRASSPSSVTSRTSRPSRPRVMATLAGLPPGRSWGWPLRSGTTSTSASPTTRTRGCASVMPPSCRCGTPSDRATALARLGRQRQSRQEGRLHRVVEVGLARPDRRLRWLAGSSSWCQEPRSTSRRWVTT